DRGLFLPTVVTQLSRLVGSRDDGAVGDVQRRQLRPDGIEGAQIVFTFTTKTRQLGPWRDSLARDFVEGSSRAVTVVQGRGIRIGVEKGPVLDEPVNAPRRRIGQ